MFPMSCLFCRFAKRELECHEVFRNDCVIAFLDNAPIRPGHVQIIPAAHFESFDLLPLNYSHEIIGLAQRIATVQKRLFATDRIAFLFTGGDIAHAHAHLIPMADKHDITSRRYIQEDTLTFRPMPVESEDTLTDMASRIVGELEAHG